MQAIRQASLWAISMHLSLKHEDRDHHGDARIADDPPKIGKDHFIMTGNRGPGCFDSMRKGQKIQKISDLFKRASDEV